MSVCPEEPEHLQKLFSLQILEAIFRVFFWAVLSNLKFAKCTSFGGRLSGISLRVQEQRRLSSPVDYLLEAL